MLIVTVMWRGKATDVENWKALDAVSVLETERGLIFLTSSLWRLRETLELLLTQQPTMAACVYLQRSLTGYY